MVSLSQKLIVIFTAEGTLHLTHSNHESLTSRPLTFTWIKFTVLSVVKTQFSFDSNKYVTYIEKLTSSLVSYLTLHPSPLFLYFGSLQPLWKHGPRTSYTHKINKVKRPVDSELVFYDDLLYR